MQRVLSILGVTYLKSYHLHLVRMGEEVEDPSERRESLFKCVEDIFVLFFNLLTQSRVLGPCLS